MGPDRLSNMNPNIQKEIARRRTFAIVSHPDAGKTTLTEKFLLYGGALHLAGSVTARKNQRATTSDWMELDHDFLAALSNAGMGARDTNTTVALGQSICPALVKPGSSFVEAAATARQGGVPPALAGFFAGLAIQHYCPQMISRVADGSFVDQLSMLRGMNIPGL